MFFSSSLGRKPFASLLQRIGQLFVLALFMLLLTHQPLALSAGPLAGTISGNVFRDYDADGGDDGPAEPGLGGVLVTATDNAGNIQTATTATDGSYTIPLLPGNSARVEFTLPDSLRLQAGPVNGALAGSTVQFVDISAGNVSNVNVGFYSPSDYCQANPDLVTNCYVQGDQTGVGTVIVAQPYTANQNTNTLDDDQSVANQVGTTYGLAYMRSSGTLFAAAFTKRNAGYGPTLAGNPYSDGTGIIYRITYGGANDGTPFLDLDVLFGNSSQTGLNPHTNYLPANGDADFDLGAYAAVGKVAFGDMDMSPDESTLYIINLADRHLYEIPVGAGVTPPTQASQVRHTPVPDPGCVNGVARPFGLAVHNGFVYVGGVCTAEKVGGTAADLLAYVYQFDPLTGTYSSEPVLQSPLNYVRGCSDIWTAYPYYCRDGIAGLLAEWQPWRDALDTTYPAGYDAGFIAQPQPILSDIEFVGEDMVLAFRDRFGDQMGNYDPGPTEAFPPGGNNIIMLPAGDILRASPNPSETGHWVIEKAGQSVPPGSFGPSAGANNEQGPGGGEFYYQDNLGGSHDELIFGGLAQVPSNPEISMTAFDPWDVFTGGTIQLSNTTGGRVRGYEIYATGDFQKANGLGDLEAICAAAPLEIGNRVWIDTNNNGRQDPDESGRANVTIQLYSNAGTLLDTVTTDTNGLWRFTTTDGLQPATAYYLIIDPTEFIAGGDLFGYSATTHHSTTDPIDNNAQAITTNALGARTGMLYTTGPVGANDHTLDFGFTPLVSLGDFLWNDKNNDGLYDLPVRLGDTVWYDLNANGLQDSGETGVSGVIVALHQATDANCSVPPLSLTHTGVDGRYLFDNLPPGNYFVCFDLLTIPPGYSVTTSNVGGDDTIDSDANTVSGQTAATGALTAGQQNLTLDMGLTATGVVSVGDRVWYDLNRDGIQDASETTGVPGIRVELYRNGETCAVSTPSASTYTNQTGYYQFAGLTPGNYFVCFDQGSLPAGYEITSQNQGGDDSRDSDADTTTGVTASTGALIAGQSNMTLDMGIRATNATTNSLGDRVWFDRNQDGDQDGGTEPGVAGVTVSLHPAGGSCADIPLAVTSTNNQGNYLFTGLPDGSYFVCFDLDTIPTSTQVTPINQGGDGTQDSDANSTTGQTVSVAVAGGMSNLTLDMGLIVAATVTVGDRVWYDTNRDGIQDSNENQGVSGITVALQPDGATCTDTPLATTSTDNTGYYLFAGLTPGNYFVCFNLATLPAGYQVTSQNQGGNDALDSDASAVDGATAPTGNLTAGQVNLTLDMGIRATNATTNSLGDRVWYDRDRDGVQDANEGGTHRVQVTLHRSTDANCSATPLATTTTNELGLYLFSGLPDGSYFVCFDLTTLPGGFAVTTQGAGPGSGTATDSDANTTSGQTPTVALAGGVTNTDLDMGIRLSNAGVVAVGDRVWLDSDRDNVQDVGELGVPGIRVDLHTGAPTCGTTAPFATTVTDAQGYYLFTNLPGNTYRVCFRLPVPTGFQIVTIDVGGDDRVDSDAVIATGLSNTTGALALGQADLTLDMGIQSPAAATVSIGNFVWYDQDNDGIQDAAEPGVPNVNVTLFNSTARPLATTTTDNTGAYLFTGLPAGSYYVVFNLNTIPTGFRPTIPGTGIGSGSATDSDANPRTGRTNLITLIAPGSNLDLDMGITALTVRVGDLGWLDSNRDGLQDSTELGVPGIQVELYTSGEVCRWTDVWTHAGTQDEWEYGSPTYFTAVATFAGSCNSGSFCWGTDLNNSYNNTGNQDLYSPVIPIPVGATAPITVRWARAYSLSNAGDTVQGFYRCNGGAWTALAAANAGAANVAWGFQNSGATCAPGQNLELRFNLTSDAAGGANNAGFYIDDITIFDTLGTIYNTDFEPASPTRSYTDSNGAYLFTDQAPGNYFTCFAVNTRPSNTEITTQNAGGNDTLDSDANTLTGVTANTGLLTGGQADLTLDIGVRTTTANQVSVGDYVWYDQNANGLQEANEAGVTGVKVTLFETTNSRPIATTTTNSLGLYLFNGLPAGNYYVIFDLSTLPVGYVPTTANVGGNDAIDSDAAVTTGQTAATGAIAAPGSNLTLDMGIIPAGNVRVGDRVWQDQDQDGRQDEAEPGVPGVTVYLHSQSQSDSCADTPLGSSITNQYGYYLFANLAPGNYFVCFDLDSLPGGYQVTAADTEADDALDSDANPVTGRTAPTGSLTNGRFDLTLDIGIYNTGNVTIGDTVWYDGNNNGLQDIGEGGVEGVRVELYRNGQICGRDFPLAVTSTANNGSYLFTNLPTGSYFVCFDLGTLPTGYTVTTPNAGTDTQDSDADATTGATAATASLTTGQSDLTLDMGIRQSAAGTVAVGDYVWYDADRDGTQDAAEAGVPGVTVDLHTSGQTCADAPVNSTTTTNTGYYLFSGLAAGNYFVCFDLLTLPTNYIVTLQNATGNDGTDSDADPLTGQTADTGALAAGEVNRTLDMGIYTPDHEIPLAGVTVQLYAGATLCDGSSYLLQVTSDANGNYIFPDLPAGNYYIHIPASNFGVGQPLEYMISSTGNDPAPDPDSNASNIDDNGTAITVGSCSGGVSSAITTLAVATEPTGDGNTDPNIPDVSHNLTVDMGFFEPLCLGDLVWLDADNSGTLNGTEYGLNGINLNLYRDVNNNGTFEPGGGDGAAIANATTAQVGGVNGSYSFCTLIPDDYFIHIPATEFQPGDLLYLFGSSTANNNPETTVAEDDDNGTDGGNAAANGIVSVAHVTLALQTEPTTDNNTNDNGRRDSSTNQMVDFGVYRTVPMDYGDLPTTYNNTILGENGPRHTSNGLSLGLVWDADNDGQESAAANGDDLNADDEDGVAWSGNWSDGTGDLTVTSSGNGCLNIWLDFTNGTVLTPDGDFNDTYVTGGTFPEHVVQNLVVISGATPVSFNLPLNAANSATFNLRARLTPRDAGNGCAAAEAYAGGSGASATGLATGGEIEDYQIQFGPTTISLQQLTVAQSVGVAAAVMALLLLAGFTVGLILYRRRVH